MRVQTCEALRLSALQGFQVLDTAPEPDFDDLTELARSLFAVPIALVSLVDADRQWFKSRIGTELVSTARSASFCAHALDGSDVLVVEDALLDPRFADNPLVLGDPYVRFYAGAPLVADGGLVLGTLCVLDTQPRSFGEVERTRLAALSRQVMAQLVLRKHARELAREVDAHQQARAELENNRTLLTSILAATDSLVYAKDLDGRFLMTNPALDGALGVAEGAVLGLSNFDVFPRAAAQEFRRHDRQIAESGVPQTYEEALPYPDGKVHHFLSAKFPLRDKDGTIFGVGGVSTDITVLTNQQHQLQAGKQRWQALFTGSPVGIILIDDSDVIVEANSEFCALIGRPVTDIVGRAGLDFGRSIGLSQHEDPAVLIAESPDGIARTEVGFTDGAGAYRWALLSITHVPGDSGAPWTLGHLQDITGRRRSELAVAESEANLHAVARVVRDIQNGADARQSIVDAGRDLASADLVSLLEPSAHSAALRVTASTDAALVGTHIELSAESLTVEVYRTGQPHFITDAAGHPPISSILMTRTGNRAAYAVPVQSSRARTGVLVVAWQQPLVELDDQRSNAVLLLADQAGVALRQVALLAELDTLAHTDPLTCLPNRRDWDAQLALRMDISRRTARPLTIALADLDHFKKFNDTFGHPAGDKLLQEFGDAAATCLRANDLVARWGGEEFAIALTDCAASAAEDLLERIRAAVPAGQTCSIGLATWNGIDSAEEFTQRADRALYHAKSSGRDRICREPVDAN